MDIEEAIYKINCALSYLVYKNSLESVHAFSESLVKDAHKKIDELLREHEKGNHLFYCECPFWLAEDRLLLMIVDEEAKTK